MNVIIDAIPLLSPLTGIGKYTYEISRRFPLLDTEHDYSYYYGYFSDQLRCGEGAGGAGSSVKEKVCKIRGLGRLARKMKGVVSSLSMKKFDLYFEPNFIPLNIKAQSTVTTIADFSFLVQPDWHPRERIEYFQEFFWKRIGKADRIIVISDFIKKSAIEFGLPEEILRTIHLGVDGETFRLKDSNQLGETKKKFNLPDNFILFVGSIEPRKNLLRLVQAYLSLEKTIRNEFKLVLVGFKGWENREIMELLSEAKEDILYAGYVPEQELADIYNLATLFVYPSLYEGFGLPALEAMACGCPVVTSNVASIPEVCGDAAMLVDPLDEESIADGLRRLVGDETLRQELRLKGLDRVKLFSWERSAKEHLKVFEEVCRP
jgi:glycosyltransferase involved in cell wall biosynthesis